MANPMAALQQQASQRSAASTLATLMMVGKKHVPAAPKDNTSGAVPLNTLAGGCVMQSLYTAIRTTYSSCALQ